MEQRVINYRLVWERLEDGTKRAWFEALGVKYSTVRSIEDAYPDAMIIQDKSVKVPYGEFLVDFYTKPDAVIIQDKESNQ